MVCVQRNVLQARAVILEQHIIADRIHERPQPLRLTNPTLRAQRTDYPRKSLLPKVVHNFGSQKTCSKLNLNEFGEILNKMAFRRRIAFSEPTQVGFVERKKFQHFPRSAGKYSRDSANVATCRGKKNLRLPVNFAPEMKRSALPAHYWP